MIERVDSSSSSSEGGPGALEGQGGKESDYIGKLYIRNIIKPSHDKQRRHTTNSNHNHTYIITLMVVGLMD